MYAAPVVCCGVLCCGVAFLPQAPLTLVAMASNPKFCTYAYLDADIAVPEIVLSCIMYLRHVSHIPGNSTTGVCYCHRVLGWGMSRGLPCRP